MNIALLIAGGSGARMHQNIPKQFLTVNERPVVVYTLEAFQNHPEIDEIGVDMHRRLGVSSLGVCRPV